MKLFLCLAMSLSFIQCRTGKTTADSASPKEAAAPAPAKLVKAQPTKTKAPTPQGQPLADKDLARQLYDATAESIATSQATKKADHEIVEISEFDAFHFEVISMLKNGKTADAQTDADTLEIKLVGSYRKTPDLYDHPDATAACVRFVADVPVTRGEAGWKFSQDKLAINDETPAECI